MLPSSRPARRLRRPAVYDPAMIRRVVVTTGARLHFGPLAVHAQEGRSFGGVGLMIDAPATEVAIERAERDEVHGEDARGRIAQILMRFRNASLLADPACRIEVVRSASPHTGLGSGTQLSLAVAKGLSLLAGEPDISPVELARRTGRGGRSAIGTHGFLHGGFLVDAGIAPAEPELGELAAREPCRAEWRFLLATPPAEGLSGTAEQHAFGTLSPMARTMTAELCRIILTAWLPAVRCADFAAFCQALDEFGRIVGEYFAPVQGGVFAHPRMAALAHQLHASGMDGIAQSSWGPTIAICCADESAAARLHRDLSGEAAWSDCRFQIVRPLNTGARIAVES
jgi:beta-ribofuranosylaminobenzene 5'-phosphate synthase